MFAAFILIFWMVWSANRDVYALSESLWFTLLVVILQAGMDFNMPLITNEWMLKHAVLWAYAALAMFAGNRWGTSFMFTVVLAVAAGLGYYWLYGNAGTFVAQYLAA
ncbi:hypothetical protein [Neisseria sp.]|uniref:hypothetical protein n=1 Tax=Neisseria sp. TaxID=192066 RepID=UPI0035A01D61